MQPNAARSREHQVIFCGLEVLRLIGERIESSSDVDQQDVDVVLGFLHDVAHKCLENTEHILRSASLERNVANHQLTRTAFDELSCSWATDQFPSACRAYSELLANSIFDDRRCVSKLDCDPLALSQFYEWEREIDEISRQYRQTLHRLEIKYTHPHCI